MQDRRIELKVKIKSLAEEAKIIRAEERKAKARRDYMLLTQLQNHRRGIVRSEARHAQLAYRIVALKGSFPKAEGPRTRTPLDLAKLNRLVLQFGPIWDSDKESREAFIERNNAIAGMYQGMLLIAGDLNKESVACYLESQLERSEINRVRKERYKARETAVQAVMDAVDREHANQ